MICEFENVLSKFEIKSSQVNTYQAICPAHEDHSPSLSIRIEDERVLLHCFAGCSTDAVLASVGLSYDDFFKKTESQYNNVNAPKVLATHHYYDEQNKLQYSVEKYLKDNKKQFRFYHFEDNKKIYNLKNVKKVLYRLPELIEGIDKTEFVCICEGEKDVDNLMNLGLLATTNPTGAEGWKAEYNNYFPNSNVVIFEDNDEAGRKRTKKLISELSNFAKSIKVIDFPDLPEHSDVSDWLEQGGTKEMLLKKIQNAQTIESQYSTIEEIQNYIYGEKYFLYRIRVVELLTKKNHIRFLSAKEQFLVFNGRYWESTSNSFIASLFSNWLIEEHRNSNKYKLIIEDLKLTNSINIEEGVFNQYPELLNLNNCIFNVKTNKALIHSSEYYFDYCLDYDYEPTIECPTFKKLLKDYSLNDENWIKLIQEIGGYLLLGELPFQKMFWLFSKSGRNGKGTILRVFHSILGDKLVKGDFDTKYLKENRFYKKDLAEKRLIYSGDMENSIFALNTLKSISGGDRQTSDVKFSNSINFQVTGKLIFSMNNLPKIHQDENKEPLRKRIIFAEFFYEITNPNSKVEVELMKERSGILNFFLEGLSRLIKNEGFTETKFGKLILSIFMEDDDVLEVFLNEFIEYDENAEGIYLKNIREFYMNAIIKISNTKTIEKHNKYLSVREKDIAKRLRKLHSQLEFTKKTIINSGNYTFIPQLKFCKEIEKVF